MADLRDVIETELRDRYTLERELGEGGMARVWIAKDIRHNRAVALKVLRPELALSGVADRFLREVRVLAELQHPHILALLDSGSLPLTPGGERICPFYVMPLVRGETLRNRLTREGPLPIDAVNIITSQIAGALDYAHKRGVVHRDVKPENVLIADDQVYLADFGIASALEDAAGDRLTETGLTLGTPAYMSPEQAAAERRIDGRSDQYSLACVVFEMLAGEPPFSGPTAQAILAKRLSGPAPSIGVLRPSLPAQVAGVLARALAQAPADRYPTSGAFAAALQASPLAIPRRTARISSRGMVLVVAALLLTTLTAYVLYVRPSTAQNRRARDPTTTEIFQRAERARSQRTQAGIIDAMRLYGAAIARDSTYAEAWSGLARTYAFAYSWAFSIPGVPSDSLLDQALRASDGAFVTDSGLASTWVTRAIVMRLVSPSSRADVFRALHRALAIDSLDSETWFALATATAESDNLEQATDMWRRAVRLKPTYGEPVAFLALAHFWARRYDSATVWADSAIALSPTYVLARQTAGYTALARGDAPRAEREFAAAERLGGGAERMGSLAGIATARAASGDTAGARRVLLGADSVAGGYPRVTVHTAVYLAEGWGAVGDRDRAFAWLQHYEQPLDLHFLLHLRYDPAMDALRSDPRFATLLRPSVH